MKVYCQNYLIILFICSFFFSSCEKEEPVTEILPAPAVHNLEIIKDIVLYRDQSSVIPEPTIEFNYPVGKESRSYGDKKNYRLTVDSYSVKYNGKTINEIENLVFSDDSLSLTVNTDHIIDSDTEVTISINVFWEVYEMKDQHGQWVKVNWENNDLGQEKVQTFQSKKLEDKFYQENIQSVYPIPNQYHFHKGEYAKGYILLYKNQSFPSGSSGMVVRVSNSQLGYYLEIPLEHNEEQKIFSFNVPQDLEKETIYQVEYLRKEAGSEKVLYQYHFRTSKYDLFAEKLAAMEHKSDYLKTIQPMVQELIKLYGAVEPFDKHEIGLQKKPLWSTEPTADVQTGLVRLEALLDDNTHYNERVFPLVYDSFEGTGFDPKWRSTEAYSLPPKEAIYFRQGQEAFELTQEQVSDNSAPSFEGGVSMIYNLAIPYSSDFSVMRTAVAGYISANFEKESDAPERLRRIYNARFPPFIYGEYQFKISYTLPGIDKVTYEKPMVVTYEF